MYCVVLTIPDLDHHVLTVLCNSSIDEYDQGKLDNKIINYVTIFIPGMPLIIMCDCMCSAFV